MSAEFTDIRKASCAGTWYPSEPLELTQQIAGYFAEVKKIPLEKKPLGLIVPHAGYMYSGRTAAKGYKLIEGETYDTVVVVAPSHKVFFKGCAVYNGSGYQTPLGVVEVDKELSEKIADIHPSVYFSNMGHAAGEARGEHALELQLPFLQIVLGNFKMVAIVMGDQEEDTVNALAETLATSLKGQDVLMVASSDLSHFNSEKQANRLDSVVERAVKEFNPESLIDALERGKAEACGGGIIAAVMKAAKRLGASRTEVVGYTTSAETTGDFSNVVGYLSGVIVSGKEVVKDPLMGAPVKKDKNELILNDENKQWLLLIAKDAIKTKLEGKEYTAPAIEEFEVKRGLFVTLKLDGELRGCIGLVKARQPLYDAVAEMAQAAAFEDPRFPMLTEEEYDRLEFEISILSPLKRVHKLAEIKVGRDGLLIKLDLHSGLLLPQVAEEYGWSVTEFVEQTCLKAGLPKNSYKDRHCELYRFEAEVF